MFEKKEIKVALKEIGVPCNQSGYEYIQEAVMIIQTVKGYDRGIVTKVIYPTIAKNHATTPSGAERCIRHSITCAFNRARPKVIDKIFGNTYSAEKGKPTNSEFLFALYEYLNDKEESEG